MRRKALLIGITYAGTSAHLNGCVNDVVYMQTCLVRNFGFDPKMIFILWYAAPGATRPPRRCRGADDADDVANDRDTDSISTNGSQHAHPTRKNILTAMEWLVRRAPEIVT